MTLIIKVFWKKITCINDSLNICRLEHRTCKKKNSARLGFVNLQQIKFTRMSYSVTSVTTKFSTMGKRNWE